MDFTINHFVWKHKPFFMDMYEQEGFTLNYWQWLLLERTRVVGLGGGWGYRARVPCRSGEHFPLPLHKGSGFKHGKTNTLFFASSWSFIIMAKRKLQKYKCGTKTKGEEEEKADQTCQQNSGRWIAERQGITGSAGERKQKSKSWRKKPQTSQPVRTTKPRGGRD